MVEAENYQSQPAQVSDLGFRVAKLEAELKVLRIELARREIEAGSDLGTVLVTGGAGYIGSHTVRELLEAGFQVVVFDSLFWGHQKSIPEKVKFEFGDMRNRARLDEVFKKHRPKFVIHFAARHEIPDSVKNPAEYFEVNLSGGLNLLDTMRAHRVRFLVFSSSAAVYGEPKKIPISEEEAGSPVNPYGWTKWAFERALQAYDAAYDLKSVSLRYFCAAGAHPDGTIGEDHPTENHVIPILFQAAILKRDKFNIYGVNWPTPDGSPIRDYVHVVDLARAHLKALRYLEDGGQTDVFNVGTGRGYSVRELVNAVKELTGRDFPVVSAESRPGDPARLVADVSKIKRVLGWQAEYQDVKSIIETAWRWHQSHPDGYQDRGELLDASQITRKNQLPLSDQIDRGQTAKLDQKLNV